MPTPSAPPITVLSAFALDPAGVTPIDMGNINRTYIVGRGVERFILQWLNPIFGPEVHRDIEAVTAHLAAKGMLTPRLVRANGGALWVNDDDGGVWRLMTFIDGDIRSSGATPELCRAGGALLGRFHRAVADLKHAFSNTRPGVHDTARHLQHLEDVLQSHRLHAACRDVGPIGHDILAAAALTPPLGELPARIVHGDPKLNNIVFSSAGEALCLIDLDTLSRMTIPVELGDAFRSWCNRTGEDVVDATFDLTLFAAGITGYAGETAGFLTPAEVDAIPTAVETIALELAARFAADALEERYFGWSRSRFPSASAHHLHRAKGQLALGLSIARARTDLRRITRQSFA
jgi:Ser/Thr protein kinase RdoA (MazF antagonist)